MTLVVPLVSALVRPLAAPLIGRWNGRSAFSPASLFAAGEVGVWYDPSDLTTLFTDTAGTTPVTTPGQTVALMRDKSGRSNHATQATTLSRPTYRVDGGGRPYLEFDGSDDFMLTGTITPGVDKAQIFAGVRKLNDSIERFLLETGLAAAGSVSMRAPAAGNDYAFNSRTSSGSFAAISANTFTSPISNVLTGQGDISGNIVRLRINGGVAAENISNQGVGSYSSLPINIGRRSSGAGPFNGHLYGLIVRFSATNLDAAMVGQTETWMNQRTGAY